MQNLIRPIFILLFVPSLHLYAGTSAHPQKTVYFCNDPDWYPVDYTDQQGHPKGIAVDILKWLFKNELTQYRLVHWPTRTGGESLKAFRQNKCQIISEAIRTPKREQYMLFTQPLMEYPVIFVTEKAAPPIFNLND